MEIQIPAAGQDSAADSLSTSGTGFQTGPDSWSREGHISTSAAAAETQHGAFPQQQNLVLDAESTETDLGVYEDTGTSTVGSHAADDPSLKMMGSSDVTSTVDEDASRTRLAAEEAADKYLAAPGSDSQGKDSGSQAEEEGKPQEMQDSSSTGDREQMETTPETDNRADAENGPEWSEMGAGQSCNPGTGDADSVKLGVAEGNSLQNTQADDGSDSDSEERVEENAVQETMERDEETGSANENDDKENIGESGRVFITENHDVDEAGSISDVRADTPDWDETGDADDAASLSDVEEFISMKRTRSSAHSRVRPGTRSTIREEVASGHRAVANTPVSYYTTTDLNAEMYRNMESRNTTHAGLESACDAVFQQAMTLMTNRCVSVQGARDGALYSREMVPYGPHVPKYFYVQQRKPAPMPPLKAWRGYHGNVYFEPIHVSKVGGNSTDQVDPYLSRKAQLSRLSRRSFGPEALPVTRSTTRLTNRRGAASAKSVTSSVAAISQHHVLYLDKHAVVNPDNTQMHEELQVIEKQQSTGSLAVQMQERRRNQRSAGGSSSRGEKGRDGNRRGAKSAKFDRICRGSVAHQLHRAKSGSSLDGNSTRAQNGTRSQENGAEESSTKLMVIGDRFAPPTVMSPLLRTQTQYSLSSQRMTMNSPDLYGAFERLPPLEQVRISLRHMDARGDDTYPPRTASPYSTGGSIGVMEDLKPFIKYSPDVKAQYNRQIKYY
ncbi:hypothetical protein BaRGS_00018886 [Batillaria attramentaria]|uniref:Btz domain-containing protein n=1 Tax=Batillaria attramentaria TaxID=370345 RepID=A0ABD0KSJ4_9CAEN